MSADAERRHQILRRLGLSEYAARAYVALLELGPAEARDVSRLAKVPVAKVYSTLDQLANRGFCTILPETPKRYAPEPMQRVMQRIEQGHLDEAARAREQAAEYARLFPVAPKDHAGDRGSATILRGRRASLDKIRQLTDNAQDVLALASDRLIAREARTLASDTRTKHRLLVVEDAQGTPLEALPDGIDVRTIPNRRAAPHAVSIRVYDDTAVLLAHHVPDDTSAHNGHDVSVVILEQAIVRAIRDLLELSWSQQSILATLSQDPAAPRTGRSPPG